MKNQTTYQLNEKTIEVYINGAKFLIEINDDSLTVSAIELGKKIIVEPIASNSINIISKKSFSK